MGAAHSSEPRSVSMENPEPSKIVDISDEVVQRLKSSISKQAKENASAAKASSTRESKQEARAVPLKPAAKAASPARTPPPPAVYSGTTAPAYAAAVGGPTISAIDVRRQKEIELAQNDAMWRQRMTQLEQSLNKTNAALEKEYSAAVNDVRNRFATASPVHQLPPCQDLKAQVIACYRAHPGETLKCSEEVALFRSCIAAHRTKILEEQEDNTAPAKTAKAG